MFFGEYEHALDGKSRFILPSRFREVFSKDEIPRLFMTRGLDHCLALYREDEWMKEVERLKSQSYFKGDVRKFQRLLYARTTEVVCDKQGRILIPEKFKEEAGIDRDIVVLGLDNKIEVWGLQPWKQYNDENESSFEELAESLSKEDRE